MRIKSIRPKHRFFMRFLLSYIFILLIPLLTGFLSYQMTIRIVEEDARAATLALLEQSRDILDKRLLEVDDMVKQLSWNYNVKQMLDVQQPIQGASIMQVKKVFDDLASYRIANSFINTFYIYFKNSDIIISPYTTFLRPNLDYNRYLKFGNLDYEGWHKEILSKYYNKGYLPETQIRFNNQNKLTIPYIQSIPIESVGQKNDGNIIVLLDVSEINQLMSKLDFSKGGWVNIVDKKGQVLTTMGTDNNIAGTLDFMKQKEINFKDYRVNGQSYYLYRINSNYNGWTFIAAMPHKVVMAKVDSIRKLILRYMLVALILGVLIAYLLAHRNSVPIKNLIKILRERIGGEASNTGNEYDFLRGSISKLIESNEGLQQSMHNQIPILRASFLEKLLKGYYNSASEIEIAMSQIDMRIKGRFFGVLIIQINGYNGMTSKDIHKELNVTKIVIREVIEEMYPEKRFLHDVDTDRIAMLLVLEQQSIPEYVKETAAFAGELFNRLSTAYGIRVSFACGNFYENLTDACSSYSEASRAMEYRVAERGSKIVWYDKSKRDSTRYYYPVELELKFMNIIKSGDMDEIGKVLKQIFLENFEKRELSSKMIRQLVYELKGTVIKLMDIVVDEDVDSTKAKEAAERIDHVETVDEIYKAIMDACQAIYIMIEDKKKNRNLSLIDNIINYINNAYTNSDLCLYSVSSQFGLAEVYLSQFFKEQTGENFSTYVENLRIEKACELLAQTKLSINDISERVGYNSAHAFRRAFKKVKGVIPNSFRDITHDESENDTVL